MKNGMILILFYYYYHFILDDDFTSFIISFTNSLLLSLHVIVPLSNGTKVLKVAWTPVFVLIVLKGRENVRIEGNESGEDISIK